MKLIIAGSRTATLAHVEAAVAELPSGTWDMTTEVVSGGAQGADTAGERVADVFGTKKVRFLADWEKYGHAAGPMRNRAMAKYADELLAVWDGKSRGTKNMIEEMRKLGKPVYVYRFDV